MINPKQVFNFTPEQKKTDADNEIKLTWTVPVNLPYFEGHFPDNPLLPGVAVLDLIQELLDAKLQYVKAAKFTEFIRPGDSLFFKVKHNPVGNLWNVHIENQNQVSVCKMSLQLSPKT